MPNSWSPTRVTIWCWAGAGAEIFDLVSLPDAGDRISGFVAADDTIRLQSLSFIGLPDGRLASGACRAGALATGADDRIPHDAATGGHWFDTGGEGGAAAVRFATLDTG